MGGRRQPKIFCIGLSKTGTLSLTEALRILEYDARHWDYTIGSLTNEDGKLKIDFSKFEPYDAFLDTPVSVIYRELDQKFPGSKFILTIRETKSWLKSCKNQFVALPRKEYKTRMAILTTTDKIRVELYGNIEFDPKTFKAGYKKHVEGVLNYFKDRPEDFLVLDICGGEGWEKLCPFLGKAIPTVAFPSTHVTKKKVKRFLKRNLNKLNKW